MTKKLVLVLVLISSHLTKAKGKKSMSSYAFLQLIDFFVVYLQRLEVSDMHCHSSNPTSENSKGCQYSGVLAIALGSFFSPLACHTVAKS
jgi:hypothetical protein